MRIQIFDVGHGGCAVVTGSNGARVMLDCGFNSERSWFPSAAFAGQRLDLLVATNLDEDHLDDLPYLWNHVTIGGIVSNASVTASALRSMKPDGMDDGVRRVHELLPHFNNGRLGTVPIDMGTSVRGWYYNNSFPSFSKTNDLSLAVFFRSGTFTILFAGDLEGPGWRSLIGLPGFAADLASVNVLVASHHGRDSGCCDEVFQFMRPHIVIFSDGEKQYETQETRDWYARRTLGIPDFSMPAVSGVSRVRRVLTTLHDGSINIAVTPGYFNVHTERSVGTWPFPELAAPRYPLVKSNALDAFFGNLAA